MHGEGSRTPEQAIDPNFEESQAEIKRREFVTDMFQGATEQLMNETQHERRKNETLEIQLAQEKIKAEHDPLTELLNRRGFASVIEKVREQNPDKENLGALLVLDIDFFKSFNTDFGHDGGDRALKIAAQYLVENSRPGDLVVRLGGEEMAIFLPGATSQDVINKFPGKHPSEGKIEVPVDFENEHRKVNVITFSGGVTELSANEDLEEAISRADKALYDAKDNGRNHILIAPNAS